MIDDLYGPARGKMMPEHPLTKLILSEAGFPESVVVCALRRRLTDVVVTIIWRLGTGPGASTRTLKVGNEEVKTTSLGPSRLPEHLLRWRYPWECVSELEELVEQTAWSLGGGRIERYANPPYSGELPYTAPGSGILPNFCGLEKSYEFPSRGAATTGKLNNEDLLEEAARTGYWWWRFDVCFRMHEAKFCDTYFKELRKKDPTLRDDGSRAGQFPGWLPREDFCGISAEEWLRTAKRFETDAVESYSIVYDLARRRIRYEDYNVPGRPDASNLKYGLHIHYGMATFADPDEQGQLPTDRFMPTSLNVQDWASAAKAAGMTFAILTAKPKSGFCLWDSADCSYNVAHSPFKGDIIGDFVAACKKQGIWPGVHYSIADAHSEGDVREEGPVSAGYFALIKQHLTELHTRYPAIRLQFLDGIGRLSEDQFEEIGQLIRAKNSRCVILNDRRQQNRGVCCECECGVKGLARNPQEKLDPVRQVFTFYKMTREAGVTFLLNIAPDPSGCIPDDQLALLTQLKEPIANYDRNDDY